MSSVQKEKIDFPTRISKTAPASGTNLTYQFSHVKISQSPNANWFSWSDHPKIQFSMPMISWEQSLQVGFSDLRHHEFRQNFNCSNPSCLCFTGIEDNEHFLLHCSRFATQRGDLLDLVSSLSNVEIMRLSSKELSDLLLYGHPNFTLVTNRAIVESTIKFIKSTRRFKTN